MLNYSVKFKIVLSLLLLFAVASCGGGGGSSPAVSPGVSESSVELVLFADRIVTNSNKSIVVQASLTDGNGKPILSENVSFTVLSGPAVLSESSAKTDAKGVATSIVSVDSYSGMIVLQVSAGSYGGVQDIISLYFVDTTELKPSLFLYPDGNVNNVYGEPADYSIVSERTIAMKAVFRDITGAAAEGRAIMFGSDAANVTFDKQTALTGADGEAFTSFKITSTKSNRVVTLYATDLPTGAIDIISINVIPEIAALILMNPQSTPLQPGESIAIETCVLNSNGKPMSDGSVIRYSTTPNTTGTIEHMFGSTINGCNTVNFFANTAGDVTVTATCEGISEKTRLTVTKPAQDLKITPETGTASVNTPLTMMVSGGRAPYSIISSSTSASLSSKKLTFDGGTFTVTGVAVENVTITAMDSIGNMVTALISFNEDASPLLLYPSEAETGVGVGISFVIAGGKAPYKIHSSSLTATVDPLIVSNPGGAFTVADTVFETVILTVEDSSHKITTATLVVIP